MTKFGYLFAGQGSQYVGMGRDLYESFSASKEVFDRADKVLGFALSNLCFSGPQEDLTRTQNCQPAILTVSIAAWEAFKQVTKSQGPKVTSFAAGLSLGEYSALVAAGAMTFEDAVSLVRRRGEFMEAEAVKKPGGMLTLIGADLETVEKICSATHTEIANINCPGQIVISGKKDDIAAAQKLAEERGVKKAVLLEVSGAFHSSLMKGASLKLAHELEKVKISEPHFYFLTNVTALPVSSPVEIKQNLIKQVASSVLWQGSMEYVLSQGVRKFYEFGPGKVLKGLMRRINAEAEVINIEKKEDIDKLAHVEVM